MRIRVLLAAARLAMALFPRGFRKVPGTGYGVQRRNGESPWDFITDSASVAIA